MNAKAIEQRLSEAGHKLTGPRKQIGAWISEHKGIFSAREVRTALPALDTVSIYRTLDLLASLDIIHKVIVLHGEQHYEVHGDDSHHHHITCTECEATECLPCEVPTQKISLFKNIHHIVMFTGLCRQCAS